MINTTKTSYHMCLNVRGILKWPKQDFNRFAKGIMKDNRGTLNTVEDVREWLLDELSEGNEKIPIGECDNFDSKEGCKGHPVAGPQT